VSLKSEAAMLEVHGFTAPRVPCLAFEHKNRYATLAIVSGVRSIDV